MSLPSDVYSIFCGAFFLIVFLSQAVSSLLTQSSGGRLYWPYHAAASSVSVAVMGVMGVLCWVALTLFAPNCFTLGEGFLVSTATSFLLTSYSALLPSLVPLFLSNNATVVSSSARLVVAGACVADRCVSRSRVREHAVCVPLDVLVLQLQYLAKKEGQCCERGCSSLSLDVECGTARDSHHSAGKVDAIRLLTPKLSGICSLAHALILDGVACG